VLTQRKTLVWLIVIGAILVVWPLVMPRFYVYLTALIMTTGLLVTSLNFALGYGGIFQFHHAVFYGVGAYATGLAIVKLGYSAWVAFLFGPIAAAIVSLIIGVICIRLSKLYFGMLQISLGSLVWAIVYRWYTFTGGDDGIHGIAMPDLLGSYSGAYYFTLIITAASMLVMYLMVKSPFGSVLQGIRDNDVRSQAIGVNVRLHQLIALVIAGFFAGVAGVLFVVVDNSIFPDMMFWTLSMEVMIMCLLGGWLTFMGPIVGAGMIVVIRTVVSGYTEYWSLILGVILMIVIFFLPDGVLGYFTNKFKRTTDKQMVKG